MNSRSVPPAVCSLPPKESSRDSDSKAGSSPRSLLAAPVRVKALEGSKMESEREIIDLQVVIGILLVVIARLNLNEVGKQWQLNQLNNAATILVFITVVINVFITAFGAHKTGFLAARTSRNPL
ncbi:ninjurin-2 isoform X3 [Halichoerus grypus]